MTGDADGGRLSREELLFGSCKYAAEQFVIIPDGTHFLLGHAYGSHRQLIARLTPDELLAYLTTSYEKASAAAKIREAHSAILDAERLATAEATTSLLSIKLTL